MSVLPYGTFRIRSFHRLGSGNSLCSLIPLITCCLLVISCDSSKTTTSGVTVTGKVFLGDTPVEAGVVTLVSDDGRVASADLGPGGQFTMHNAPTGKVYIGIDTQMLEDERRHLLHRSKGQEILRYVDVPARYANPKSSGLTEVVEAGKQLEIRLQP